MKLIFMGTPLIAAKILDALISAGYDIGYAVTQPDKAKNRGKKLMPTEVKALALEKGIEVLQPERIKGNEEFFALLKDYAPDVIVAAAYGRILPPEIIHLPKLACVNVHASLLPKYRGAAPIERAIMDGEEKSGITLMKMDEGLDTGDMIAKRELEIGKMTGGELREALSALGAELLLETLPKLEEALKNAEPQNEADSSYASMIFKEDARLDFGRSAKELSNLMRAMDPQPGAFCEFEGEKAKLFMGEELSEAERLKLEIGGDVKPGELISTDGGKLIIACGKGVLSVAEIQMPGKKRMDAAAFLRGHALKPGTLFT